MLLRGQNIVQYASFADDVVEAFVRCSAQAGVDIFRIFDALNDVRNMTTAIAAVKKAGKQVRGEICYTVSPVHDVQTFVQIGATLKEMGSDSIGIKDMAGILVPRVAGQLVSELKRRLGLPVILHCHDTAGLAAQCYVTAVDAGVDVIETSIAPFANGTAQPDTMRMLALLEGNSRCPTFNQDDLNKLRAHFEVVYKELDAFTSPANERVDCDALIYQIPGGMLSNFRSQLKEQGMSDKFDKVMSEVPYVRKCLGWVPLVTPTSQIVGTQAMLNVKFGRWKVISQPTIEVVLGKYGRTPGPVDPDVLKEAERQSGLKRIVGRPADSIPPSMEKYRSEARAKGLPDTDEITVLYAMFPQPVEAMLKPSAKPAVSAKPPLPAGAKRYAMTVNGQRHDVVVENLSLTAKTAA
jgi:oxaloacetate decarboxylase alpha subunit/pyruvate carboxylase subunit B